MSASAFISSSTLDGLTADLSCSDAHVPTRALTGSCVDVSEVCTLEDVSAPDVKEDSGALSCSVEGVHSSPSFWLIDKHIAQICPL